MNSTTRRNKMLVSALLVGGIGCLSGAANAATAELCAGTFSKNINGTAVTMWGYATGGTATAADGVTLVCAGAPSSPGPELAVPVGEALLSVTLHNTLPEGTSLIIPGQAADMTPVITAGRVTSFTSVTAPGATGTYEWAAVRPGTYAYQSGTHPARQVHMGLYGAMVNDAALGEAYPGVAYDQSVTLFYSEVDPALHDPVVQTANATNYQPKAFLVNGAPYDPTLASPTAAPGERVLLRFINMGLRDHAPTVYGPHMQIVAEDGNPYPDYKEQVSLALPAGKTKDAILSVPGTATVGYRIPIYDRMLSLSSAGAPGAGMLSFLDVGAGGVAMGDDTYGMTKGELILDIVAPGVLGNDNGATGATLVSQANNGTVTLALDGSFTYVPNDALFYGADVFTYSASLGAATATASVTINVANANLNAPVATADSVAVVNGEPVTYNVLANDTDADDDALTAVLDTGTTSGTLVLNADGSFSYTPNDATVVSDSFEYHANDGTFNSAPVTVSLSISQPVVNTPPVAVGDSAATLLDTAVSVAAPGVLANDTDADGDPLTAVLGTSTSNGALTLNTDGSFSYAPNAGYVGVDSFTYSAFDGIASSAPATVTITVTQPNRPPVAMDDSATVALRGTVVIPVLVNDSDPDGDALTVVGFTQPDNRFGSVTCTAVDCTFVSENLARLNQRPARGTTSFTYTISDGEFQSTAIVRINVTR